MAVLPDKVEHVGECLRLGFGKRCAARFVLDEEKARPEEIEKKATSESRDGEKENTAVTAGSGALRR